MADYIFLLETRFSNEQQAVVNSLQRLCQQAGLNLYLIGGPMRDLLAGAPIRTLDFSLEGSPLKLQKTLAQSGVEILYADEAEQSLRLRLQGVRFRMTAAHTALYEQRGRPPVVKPATIMDDLRRRGFTLDAIGLSLNQASRGLLLDPTNGLADIESRQIRIVHNYVFFEDPVRLLHAVRLQTRLGFALEERTQARMAAARANNYLEAAVRDSLGKELESIAYEPDVVATLKALEKEDLLESAFGKGFRTAKMDLAALGRLPAAQQQLDEAGITADQGPVALWLILASLPEKEKGRLAKFPLSKPLASGWQRLEAEAKALRKRLLARATDSLAGLHDALHHTRPEAVLLAVITSTQPKVLKKIKDFVTQIPRIRQQLPLRELQQLGAHPDTPQFHNIVESLYRRLLEGKFANDADLRAALRAEAERAGILPRPTAPKSAESKPAPSKPAKPQKAAAAAAKSSARKGKSARRP